ncbi:hypothetical protein DICA1_F04632 [Diutina catenulata]
MSSDTPKGPGAVSDTSLNLSKRSELASHGATDSLDATTSPTPTGSPSQSKLGGRSLGSDPNDEQTLSNETNETTPLIASAKSTKSPSSWYKGSRTWRVVAIVLALLFGGGIWLASVAANIQTYVDESVKITVHHVNIVGLHTNGVDVRVNATTAVDYTKISGFATSRLFRFGGWALGSLQVLPVNGVSVAAKPVQLDVEALHLADVYPTASVNVSIAQGSQQEHEIIGLALLDVTNVVKFANYVQSSDDDEVPIDLHGSMNATVVVPRFKAKLVIPGIHFSKQVILEKESIIPTIDYSYREIDAGIAFQVETLFKRPLPISISFDAMELEVLAKDCERAWVSTNTTVITKGYPSVQANDHGAQLKFSGVIGRIPQRLAQKCGQDLSPFNLLVANALQGLPVNLGLQRKTGGELYVFSPVFPSSVVGTSIHSVSARVPHHPSQLQVVHNTSASVFVTHANRLPSFQVTSFETVYRVLQGGEAILSGKSQHPEKCKVIHGGYSTEIDLSFHEHLMTVANPAIVGRMMASHDFNQSLSVELAFDKVGVVSSVLNTTLDGLKVYQSFDADSLDKIFDQVKATVDPVLPSVALNASVSRIAPSKSARDSLTLTIGGSVANVNPISVEIGDDVSCALGGSNTTFGRFTLASATLGHPQRIPFAMEVDLKTATDEEKAALEEFMSGVVSGDEGVTVSVSDCYSTRNSALAAFLKPFSWPEVHPPCFEFEKSPGGGQSPFVLESTIHAFSETVELTVFNPLDTPLAVVVRNGVASHHGLTLGHMEPYQVLVVQPGVWKSGQLPIKINDGIALDILRRAINRDLQVTVEAEVEVGIGQFYVVASYTGEDLDAKIRW